MALLVTIITLVALVSIYREIAFIGDNIHMDTASKIYIIVFKNKYFACEITALLTSLLYFSSHIYYPKVNNYFDLVFGDMLEY